MRLKILGFVFVCLLLFVSSGLKFNHAKAEVIIQEKPEVTEQKEKQKIAMKDIITIAASLADYITDNGTTPKQNGVYDENSDFYQGLSPFYVRMLPVKDPWGDNYKVYCGKKVNGHFGISGASTDDFLVVSYGRDNILEPFVFDSSNPEAGLYLIRSVEDFDKDLIMWNGSWIRAPRTRRLK